jgi:glutathione S-transferase
MKLYGTTTSPYARITRVVVFEKHLQNNIEFIWIKTRIPNDPFLSINPSGRVPFLLLSDGLGLEDTPAIVDYLDALQKPYLFLHTMDRKNWEYRRLESTAKAMLDGLAVWVREVRRPNDEQSPTIIDHELRRAERLSSFFNDLTSNPVFSEKMNLAQLYLFAALDLERRIPDFQWRTRNIELSKWFDQFNLRKSVKASLAPQPV